MAKKKIITGNELRLKTLKAIIADVKINKKLEASFTEAKGNWPATLDALKKADIDETAIRKLDFTHTLADITDDNEDLTKKLADESTTYSLREVALKHDKETLKRLIEPDKIPDTVPGNSSEEKVENAAEIINNKLYLASTSAVIQRMAKANELPIKDINICNGVFTFLDHQKEFDIRSMSIYHAINQENAFEGIKEEHRKGVISQLKDLQRIQAICPKPEPIPVLMKRKITSSFQVAEFTEKAFIKRLGKELGEPIAKQIYTNAVNNKIRIEHALMMMRETVLGTGVAAIDGKDSVKTRMIKMQNSADEQKIPLNWETLFGSVDLCECDECNSVYSPAAYFVELLQYLRNNNLDLNAKDEQAIRTDPKDISGTALEMLFRRRPDLGCLELTCKNANTVLPYIDLVNEVMESFVVHLNEYANDANYPKQASIEAYNIEDEISSELMAQPQHTNYKAYCLLKKARYPFTLPYHQPVDAARTFLKYLETSRYELMKTFRTGLLKSSFEEEIPHDDGTGRSSSSISLSDSEFSELASLHKEAIKRAIDAEYLGLIQEEYIILAKEAYWQKRYFDIKCEREYTEEEYRQKIGLGAVCEYYNYQNENTMLSTDEELHKGLTFIKEQFLKRTGILYTDLVELLKTQFINPNYPKGKALTIFENLRFSYRFMQSLVNYSSNDPKVRFGKLIEFLEKAQPLIPYIDELLHPDPCKSQKTDPCVEMKDLKKWVYCCFEKVGKLIVLESIDLLRVEKPPKHNSELVGYLTKDNTIIDSQGNIIGKVTAGGKVYDMSSQEFGDYVDVTPLYIKNSENNIVGYIDMVQLLDAQNEPINYIQIKETCDLRKIRIKHLDGSVVTSEEYDRMHRFIRLWRRMGWTIDELDKAITGLAAYPVNETEPELPCEDDCFRIFEEDCECPGSTGDCGYTENSKPKVYYEITPEFLHQLVAIKKLLEKTGLELIKLLTFWTDISTRGEKSLYKRLFLTHNLLSIDKVFKADKNGNYLAKPAKISEHITVLMAALNLKSEDIASIMAFKSIPDELSIRNVSVLYKHGLLAKLINVKAPLLKDVVLLFNDPLENADQTLSFFKTWEKMEDAGFDFRELNYIILGEDDEKKPLMPNKKTILQLAKTLFDGLNTIKNEHSDIPSDKDVSTELVRTKASLLYSQDVTERIICLLEGTTIYSTNAPKDLVINISEFDEKLSKGLKRKLRYDFASGAIQVTGLLTETEIADAKTLFSDPKWSEAFDRIAKKALPFYKDVLCNILPKPEPCGEDEAKIILLQGDVDIPDEEQDPENPISNTAPIKRLYFIKHFLPILRERLTQRLLVETLSNSCELEKEITDVLISDILKSGEPARSLKEIFGSINNQTLQNNSEWKGYLIPQAEDSYIFAATDTQPDKIKLDGQELRLHQQDDPNNVWLSEPVKLKSGKPYQFEVTGLSPDLKELTWKTATSLSVPVPQSVLLPDYSTQSAEEAFIKLHKTSLLVNNFNLKADEALYLHEHPEEFSNINFNTFTLAHWKRIEAFTRLRNSLPETDTNLIEFFTWASNTSDNTHLSDRIAKLTKWKKENIDKLISDNHFNLNKTKEFRNEKNLLKLQKALYEADKINIDINLLFDWAKPESRFWRCHEIAENIKNSLKARYKQDDWEQVVKPLNDQLRTNQRTALVDYLLVKQPIIDWPVTDEEGLFEFFMIDVKMESVMETSRIKQAISSVQLFIQRCLLGLEVDKGVPADALDRDRWEWMQRNNVWVANRKIFLYPENWIESELRDDKSPFCKELESALLQKDINPDTVKDALKDYLYKVDEVANMQVVGLFVEKDGEFSNQHNRIHVFSRTRNAPYFFFYRYYEYNYDKDKKTITGGYWYPWEKVQVDIPSYDVEDDKNQITENGTFLIPVVWNNRLLIFFPQFMKKTKPNETTNSSDFNTIATKTPDSSKPTEYWEIKMAWSEFRNGKWTQKQVSKDAIYDTEPKKIDYYYFSPQINLDENRIEILVQPINPPVSQNNKTSAKAKRKSIGAEINTVEKEKEPLFINIDVYCFIFKGNQIYTDIIEIATPSLHSSPYQEIGIDIQPSLSFHYHEIEDRDKYICSYQQDSNINFVPKFFEETNIVTFQLNSREKPHFYHPYTHQLLGKTEVANFRDFFEYAPNIVDDPIRAGETTPPLDTNAMFGLYSSDEGCVYNELVSPYSIYNWELFFHTPALLADKLSKSQQFEEAMKWFHYVFNPYAEGDDAKRFWRFFPFHETSADNYLENLFNSLKPNEYKEKISEWRDKPFRPHVVARSRPIAYMKWVVMKYLDNLIDWADYLFRQHTIETINQATQLYILAYHILGSKPQIVPRRGKIKPQTYRSLLDKWDAFGNAMVEMEIIFPYSSQTPLPLGISNGLVGFANIFGFSSSLYFCIPNNPTLLNYWKTIEGRLYNIRHCLNIEGIFSIPALWDPPIDPALLVQAAAQGLSLSSVLNDLNSPMPNYRFSYLLQKAFELCGELKSMGNALLSALEKKDAEALSNMRARHESSMSNLVMEIKKLQLKEAENALEGLEQNRKSPIYRLQHYLKLIGEDLNKVPSGNSDFTELPNQIETPIDESGLKLIKLEKEEMDKASDAADKQKHIGQIETLASILHLIPLLNAEGCPLGVGVSVAFGGQFLGNATQAIARYMQIGANELSHQSSSAGRKGGFLRQLQDRVFQANLAGYEIKQIDKQILSQKIRIQLANQEINNQQKQIENAQEVEDYLKNKYTNEELYSWMIGSIKTLYHQVYTLAYDLAKKAEKAYCFERGLSSSNFIQFSYWDASRDGLQAGERLYVGLKQLEATYQEKRGYDYEITKHISLRQVNPLALIELRETGRCEFALPEVLFDMDYPGHYMRRIKSVALSVPCIVGPYTSVNCTARLLENKFRINAIAKDGKDYLEKTDSTDDRFSTVNIPITSIAVSSGQNDSGVFELNFRDERYIPFEGAGVISKWRLEFPEKFRQFDYDTVSDVIMHIRYTSIDGGNSLRNSAVDALLEYIKSVEDLSQREGLFTFIDLRHDFPNEWQRAIQSAQTGNERIFTLNNLNDRLPIYTKNNKIEATDVILFTPSDFQAASIILTRDQTDNSFSDGVKTGNLNSYVIRDVGLSVDNWQLKITGQQTIIDKLWLIIRYVLK